MNDTNLKFKIASGLLFIVIGFSFLCSDFIVQKREETFFRVNVELNDLLAASNGNENDTSNHQEAEDVQDENENDTSNDTNETSQQVVNEPERQYEPFAGVLEIPKISFSKGFYKKGSELNNVKFNLKILDVSSYPDEEKGNVIIIGHSGNYSNSYFGNLYQLVVGDTASITYNGKKYQYKIVNIYNEEKDGTVTIYRDETKSCLTLITCTKDDDTKQTVYILEQVSVE